MKKLLGLLSIFLGLALVICLCASIFSKVPVDVPDSSRFLFKLLTGFEYYIKYLPPIMMTGFVVSCSVYFGQNAVGSSSRFSAAMFARFRHVMIAVIISFISSYACTVIPHIKNLSGGTRTIILTVIIASIVALIKPLPDEDNEETK